ncbi:cation diffusion facilitator family transporter [Paenibacillus dauci]|uniref:cation diffusion facilitator family transporter n=1 Tax=Paenibacillus dauci TaxID=1567106 RepID=UPI0006197B68|nr:cation transporter [Paenibacillus dauci]
MVRNNDIRQQGKVFWTSILAGLILAIVKAVTAYAASNKALMGDALYTASSAVSSLAERLSKRHQGRQSRRTGEDHAASKERYNKTAAPFTNLLLTVLLLLGGLEIAISAVRDLMSEQTPDPKPYAIVVVFLAMAVNEALFRYRYRYAKKQGNTRAAEEVDMHRYSLYSSILVLAGMLGTIAALELQMDNLYYIEPVSAILVAVILWRQGYRMASQTVYGTLVQELEREDAADFMDTVQRVQGVITIEDLKAQEYRDGLRIHLKIGVNPQISVQAAAEIADYAKNLLLTRFAHVSSVEVQILPYTGGYPYKSNYEWTQSREKSGDGMIH